jgi:hypothetical protein
MAGISYQTYHFIGNALTEEQFLELKNLFQLNRNLVEEKYKVFYLREIWAAFKLQLILIAVLVSILAILATFVSGRASAGEWVTVILTILFLTTILSSISMFISLLNFLSYLGDKRRFGTLHLYLLETCPDFRSYLETYLKYAR